MKLTTSIGLSNGIAPYSGSTPFTNTYSLDFDGVDESIEVDTPFTTSGNDVTISFWAKLPAIAGADYMFGGDINNIMWYDSNESWKVKIGGWNAAVLSCGVGGVPNPFDDSWHHFAVTKTGTAINFWIDGSDYVTTALSNAGGLYVKNIGSFYHGGAGVTGNMDEVAIWESDQSANMGDIYSVDGAVNLNELANPPLFWLRMGDVASWNGSAWELTDQGSGGSDSTSNNMEEADRQEEVPPS